MSLKSSGEDLKGEVTGNDMCGEIPACIRSCFTAPSRVLKRACSVPGYLAKGKTERFGAVHLSPRNPERSGEQRCASREAGGSEVHVSG